MNDKIKALICQYEEAGDFTYAKVNEIEMANAEKELKGKIPEQYKDFLELFGHGGICGVCTDGVGLDGSYVFLDNTLKYRGEGLPDNYIVIENANEWVYCIDMETGKVISWDMSGYIKEEYDSFDEYLLDQMEDAIENI